MQGSACGHEEGTSVLKGSPARGRPGPKGPSEQVVVRRARCDAESIEATLNNQCRQPCRLKGAQASCKRNKARQVGPTVATMPLWYGDPYEVENLNTDELEPDEEVFVVPDSGEAAQSYEDYLALIKVQYLL